LRRLNWIHSIAICCDEQDRFTTNVTFEDAGLDNLVFVTSNRKNSISCSVGQIGFKNRYVSPQVF